VLSSIVCLFLSFNGLLSLKFSFLSLFRYFLSVLVFHLIDFLFLFSFLSPFVCFSLSLFPFSFSFICIFLFFNYCLSCVLIIVFFLFPFLLHFFLWLSFFSCFNSFFSFLLSFFFLFVVLFLCILSFFFFFSVFFFIFCLFSLLIFPFFPLFAYILSLCFMCLLPGIIFPYSSIFIYPLSSFSTYLQLYLSILYLPSSSVFYIVCTFCSLSASQFLNIFNYFSPVCIFISFFKFCADFRFLCLAYKNKYFFIVEHHGGELAAASVDHQDRIGLWLDQSKFRGRRGRR